MPPKRCKFPHCITFVKHEWCDDHNTPAKRNACTPKTTSTGHASIAVASPRLRQLGRQSKGVWRNGGLMDLAGERQILRGLGI